MRKNDIVEIEISASAADGSGIGRADGMVVFVPSAAEGDRLNVRIEKVLKNRAYGKITEILSPSPSRQESDCAVFSKCGGCVYRHIDYTAEKQIKSRRVSDAVSRIGGFSVLPGEILCTESRTRYRNKAQFPVAADGDGKLIAGFYAPHSHRVISCDDCLLQPEIFADAVSSILEFAEEKHISAYDEESGIGLLRHIYLRRGFVTGEIMVVLIINGRRIPNGDELVSRLKARLGENLKSVQLNINTARNNVVLGEKCVVLYGEKYIEDILCGVRVRLSAQSFYQVNREMAERLYQKAAEYAQPEGKCIVDLYCGAGTIGLSMAERAEKIIGVEIVPQAVEDAEFNAKRNDIKNAEFICADAAEGARRLKERGIKPDVVIVDPPRKGCEAALLQIIANDFASERIVYVSCDPATLARDMKILSEQGYRLREYTPADLFPGTAHVETVAVMERM